MSNKIKKLLTFNIQYFKMSGKYYTEGDFQFNCTIIPCDTETTLTYTTCMDDVVEEIKRMHSLYESPCLSSWHNDFYTLVNHENGYPVLIIPHNQLE